MNSRLFFFMVLIASAISCNRPKAPDAATAIRAAEAAFARAASEKGVAAAFHEFADDSATISRAGKLYKGKAAIAAYYESQVYRSIELKWSPDFVEVARSGDLGYTYGPFTFEAVDSSGKQVSAKGYFHTVWKLQPDGSWKFVYD